MAARGRVPTVVQIMGYRDRVTVERKGFHPMTQRVYSKVVNDKVLIKDDRCSRVAGPQC
jgi:hypothetical protein